MSDSKRIEELLGGYPDQLSEEELAELRRAADQDPEVDAMLDAIHQVELLLSSDQNSPAELATEPSLSDSGEQRLAEAMRTAQDLAAAAAQDSSAVLAEKQRVAVLPGRAGRSQWAGWMALAAGLLLTVGTIVLSLFPPPAPSTPMSVPPSAGDEFSMKGEPAEVSGALMIRGTAAAPWILGEPRSLKQPVLFYAVVPQPVYLAVLEIQAANTVVLHPAAGSDWQVAAGTHVLQAPAAGSEYRPARGGVAQYVLVGSAVALQLPSGGVVTSVAALLAGNPGARELGRAEVKWLVAD